MVNLDFKNIMYLMLLKLQTYVKLNLQLHKSFGYYRGQKFIN